MKILFIAFDATKGHMSRFGKSGHEIQTGTAIMEDIIEDLKITDKNKKNASNAVERVLSKLPLYYEKFDLEVVKKTAEKTLNNFFVGSFNSNQSLFPTPIGNSFNSNQSLFPTQIVNSFNSNQDFDNLSESSYNPNMEDFEQELEDEILDSVVEFRINVQEKYNMAMGTKGFDVIEKGKHTYKNVIDYIFEHIQTEYKNQLELPEVLILSEAALGNFPSTIDILSTKYTCDDTQAGNIAVQKIAVYYKTGTTLDTVETIERLATISKKTVTEEWLSIGVTGKDSMKIGAVHLSSAYAKYKFQNQNNLIGLSEELDTMMSNENIDLIIGDFNANANNLKSFGFKGTTGFAMGPLFKEEDDRVTNFLGDPFFTTSSNQKYHYMGVFYKANKMEVEVLQLPRAIPNRSNNPNNKGLIYSDHNPIYIEIRRI